ncbi:MULTISPECIES: hypothetical protein [unclassified Streptomyces]|uniref:hypothetical protein n=1 Tax=unclassified Streptomyces TaxID=2593676 RepID=UPI002DD8F1D7|nr:hypothetical protein [Streptomyces sp. NBC_01750]WSA97889.1 hypothetical protein OIE54_00520 [Streptomyces sp. NBC_01794]WSB05133.1 hypothetical protein OIE54_41625 [Streptomyces sp. NBC_01794]WSD30533.1 hypothetical protein OG966_00165 [Streptomyces sp. NBC_01750]
MLDPRDLAVHPSEKPLEHRADDGRLRSLRPQPAEVQVVVLPPARALGIAAHQAINQGLVRIDGATSQQRDEQREIQLLDACDPSKEQVHEIVNARLESRCPHHPQSAVQEALLQ